MKPYRYRVVDVFTTTPLEGNALAVFPNASGIDDPTMQRIAKELNLAETAFVLPASRTDCAANVRIFTPTTEMVFAGHPTIGTSFVLLDEGIVAKDTLHFALEEKVGVVGIRVERGDPPMIWLRTPAVHAGRVFDREVCARALGLNTDDLLDVVPQLFSAGNPTIYIALKNVGAVDRAWLDLGGLKRLVRDGDPPTCVFVFARAAGGAYSRMFAPEHGVVEDPATGSSTGPLAAYMMQSGLIATKSGTSFVSEQGVKMGRRSLLHVEIYGDGESEGIDVGGNVTPLVEAQMFLP